jgi:hypothetical protein
VSFPDVGEEVDSAERLQLVMKKLASVRQIAAAHEILVANNCLLSISMIALKNASCCAQQVLPAS